MFKLDDIIIDRIQMAIAEDSTGLLYTLTQLAEATIETTAESKEAKSSEGTLIKKFYSGKAGTFSAKNAMLNLNVIGKASGSDKEVGKTAAESGGEAVYITVPKIVTLSSDTVDYTLVDGTKEVYVANSLKVYVLGNNGAMGDEIPVTTGTVDATHYTITGNKITLPVYTTADEKAAKPDKYVIKFLRKATNSVRIVNKAGAFPKTCKLTLKALAVDPCSPDVVRACYIIMPSFQPDPSLSLSLTTEGQLDYKGDLQVDFCSADKSLYEIVMCGEDEE